MQLITPIPLKSEHQALIAEINQAVRLTDATGEATRRIARLIESHFAREDEFVLPPLGLLPSLARGTIEQEMAAAIVMAARLHDEMSNLLAEKRVIVAAVEELMAVAETEGHPQLVGFAEKLLLHQETEEQVCYPAAILIGKYLQLRLKS
jgi:hypothetical protein